MALKDMEELLSDIHDKRFVEYMKEALACYNGGAFRGCIVMSYIALFDDMKAKLSELSRVNSNAKLIWTEVNKRANEQEVFESFMADKLKSSGLLEEALYQRLNAIRDHRNKAAHPTGMMITPEEARFVYRTVIDDFLSEALLKTTHAADAVIARLSDDNFFPTPSMTDMEAIAVEECAAVHEAAYPYLISKVVGLRKTGGAKEKLNAERFLLGIIYSKNSDFRDLLIKKVLMPSCVATEKNPLLGRIVAADASLLDGLSSIDLKRANKLLTDNVATSNVTIATQLNHPARQISSIVKSKGEAFAKKSFRKFFLAVLDKYTYVPVFYNSLKNAPELLELCLDKWKDEAGSSTFDISNGFAKVTPQIDEVVEKLINDENAFFLVVRVCRAAKRGAWQAQAVVRSRFEDSPKLFAAANKFASDSPIDAKKTLIAESVSADLDSFWVDLGA